MTEKENIFILFHFARNGIYFEHIFVNFSIDHGGEKRTPHIIYIGKRFVVIINVEKTDIQPLLIIFPDIMNDFRLVINVDNV